uniref:Uncharacterized protein n=1 Tax=Oryza sativa subsp. japonica TaxID=39947 RepID=Q5JNE0_ORYSJ|nr:hypothetical protein [Oryza sativa Japonica Group]
MRKGLAWARRVDAAIDGNRRKEEEEEAAMHTRTSDRDADNGGAEERLAPSRHLASERLATFPAAWRRRRWSAGPPPPPGLPPVWPIAGSLDAATAPCRSALASLQLTGGRHLLRACTGPPRHRLARLPSGPSPDATACSAAARRPRLFA